MTRPPTHAETVPDDATSGNATSGDGTSGGGTSGGAAHHHGLGPHAGPWHAPHGSEPTDLIMHAARALRRGWSEAIAPWDLSPHQSRALRVVCASDPAPRLADLARALRIAPRSATEVVDALEAKGLARRSPSQQDRRAVVVEATDEGVRIREAIDRARAVQAEEFMAPLTDEERDQLGALLRKVLPNR